MFGDNAPCLLRGWLFYVACDYVHPFPDGNSRTLRELTRQLAKDSGYQLDWCVFDKSKAGRDTLYIARDLSVNELALKNVKNADTKREIAFALDKYDGNKKLPELLRDCVRPERSISFEKMEEREALKKHPELHRAYSVMHKAEAQFSTTKHGIREKMLSLIKGRLIDNLDQGETKAFQMNPGITETNKGEIIDKPSNREVGPER